MVLRLSVRFWLRFSPFDGCERVNQLRMFGWGKHALSTFVINSLIHIHQKEKIAPEIAAKIASVNGNLHRGYIHIFTSQTVIIMLNKNIWIQVPFNPIACLLSRDFSPKWRAIEQLVHDCSPYDYLSVCSEINWTATHLSGLTLQIHFISNRQLSILRSPWSMPLPPISPPPRSSPCRYAPLCMSMTRWYLVLNLRHCVTLGLSFFPTENFEWFSWLPRHFDNLWPAGVLLRPRESWLTELNKSVLKLENSKFHSFNIPNGFISWDQPRPESGRNRHKIVFLRSIALPIS